MSRKCAYIIFSLLLVFSLALLHACGGGGGGSSSGGDGGSGGDGTYTVTASIMVPEITATGESELQGTWVLMTENGDAVSYSVSLAFSGTSLTIEQGECYDSGPYTLDGNTLNWTVDTSVSDTPCYPEGETLTLEDVAVSGNTLYFTLGGSTYESENVDAGASASLRAKLNSTPLTGGHMNLCTQADDGAFVIVSDVESSPVGANGTASIGIPFSKAQAYGNLNVCVSDTASGLDYFYPIPPEYLPVNNTEITTVSVAVDMPSTIITRWACSQEMFLLLSAAGALDRACSIDAATMEDFKATYQDVMDSFPTIGFSGRWDSFFDTLFFESGTISSWFENWAGSWGVTVGSLFYEEAYSGMVNFPVPDIPEPDSGGSPPDTSGECDGSTLSVTVSDAVCEAVSYGSSYAHGVGALGTACGPEGSTLSVIDSFTGPAVMDTTTGCYSWSLGSPGDYSSGCVRAADEDAETVWNFNAGSQQSSPAGTVTVTATVVSPAGETATDSMEVACQ